MDILSIKNIVSNFNKSTITYSNGNKKNISYVVSKVSGKEICISWDKGNNMVPYGVKNIRLYYVIKNGSKRHSGGYLGRFPNTGKCTLNIDELQALTEDSPVPVDKLSKKVILSKEYLSKEDVWQTNNQLWNFIKNWSVEFTIYLYETKTSFATGKHYDVD